MTRKVKHPATWNDKVLDVIADEIGRIPGPLVLDPFAGVGKLHRVLPQAVCVELEPIWAEISRPALVGNVLWLPFGAGAFDAIVTSPVYGNRMSDSHDAKDGSERRSYTHDARAMTGDPTYTLHPDNAGLLQWGPTYRHFHRVAWTEVLRTLRPGGTFFLNCKNHIRDRAIQPVNEWHLDVLMGLGLSLVWVKHVQTSGHRKGENRERVDHEIVALFEKPA